MILIVGSEGSMGRRYQAILRHLGIPFRKSDIDTPSKTFQRYCKEAEGIIVATPTDTHFDLVVSMAGLKVPILCEKPLSRNKNQLDLIRKLVEKHGLNLTMTAQYSMFDDKRTKGDTVYNYFRTGNDGLYWDCIQPIGLARGLVFVDNTSPIWTCRLNGKDLRLGDMDQAYVDFVDQWLLHPGCDIGEVIDMHHKVMEYACSSPSTYV